MIVGRQLESFIYEDILGTLDIIVIKLQTKYIYQLTL